ncbi:MAG: ABC transporter permease [Paenibacillaceae bacterium]
MSSEQSSLAKRNFTAFLWKSGQRQQLILFVVLVGLVIFFSLTTSSFFTLNNVLNVARQISMMGIVAAGMTMVLLIGGIDLSIASTVALAGVVAGLLMNKAGVDPWIAIVLGLTAAAVIGSVNGLIVTIVGIPSLITTLGMLTVVRGLAFIFTGGYPVFGFPNSVRFFGEGYLFGIPVPVIIMILVFVAVWLLLYRTYIGRHIYALGGNYEATRLSGIKTKKLQLIVFTLSGFLSGIAGIVLMGRLNSGQPNAVQGFELDVITAVVLGGVSISGGQGKLVGVLFGVLIMGVLANGLILLNVGEFYQMVVKGMVLLIAVGIDRIYGRHHTTAT